jgi:ATP-dependent DNA helicase RecG
MLERLGVTTIEEACWFLPWRYEDRSALTAIDQLYPGGEATICGVVDHITARRTFRKKMNLLTVAVTDGTGRVDVTFFNQPYLERLFAIGMRVMVSGRISATRQGWTRLQLENPQYEIVGDQEEARLHVGRLVPVYHETRGLTSRHIRLLIRHVLEDHAAHVEDAIPPAIRDTYRLLPVQKALPQVHFPDAGTSLEQLNRGTTEAHRRLAFEECLLLQLALAMRQQSVKEERKGIRFNAATPLLDRLHGLLPFTLTAAQRRVIADIAGDMASAHPMNRLIQGDVGCGKTMVALHAMLIACGSGYQAAFMVPTEILAEQHYLTLRGLLDQLGITTVVIKSGGAGKSRAATLKKIESGEAHVVVGTHALIQRSVRFRQLGLAIIDEQHKFGVLQRKVLVDKGYCPDVLVLTATPIPRTLALTVYGDLDISVIDALPPGRSPTITWLFDQSQRRRAYRVLREQVALGRQAYIVYPLVEESEKTDLQAAIQAAERLQAEEFHHCRVGLLHGRMKADDKDRAMEAFKSGAIDVLVATTVIEVGVDVPNATVMLIEHAERFGLAQLHQLRGRVGRGALQSYCLLLASAAAAGTKRDSEHLSAARARMEVLVRTIDGFLVAEEDLRIRGPGDFFGVRQWGVPEFRAANLIRDREILEQAREAAVDLLTTDPTLSFPLHRTLRDATLRRWKDTLDLAAIS